MRKAGARVKRVVLSLAFSNTEKRQTSNMSLSQIKAAAGDFPEAAFFWLWLAASAALGACIGSFLNVVIHRVPREESIVFPNSRCPACGAKIRPYDNVPVLSYLFLRGRCRACGASTAG